MLCRFPAALAVALVVPWVAASPVRGQFFPPVEVQPREFRFPEAKHKGGELRYIHGLPVLTLEGSPEAIGEQAAMLTAEHIRPLLDMPRNILRRQGIAFAWPLVSAAANRLMKNVPEDHRKELETAIKVGEVDRGAMLVGNCMLELRRLGGCATLYVDAKHSSTGGPLLGRNFDLPSFGVLDRYHLVTVVRPQGKRAFASIGYPGMTGVISGMNDAGLVVATLDVYASGDRSPMFESSGTPLTFCYRRLLEECASVEEAIKLMRSMTATTWMNLAVADGRRGVVLEITPKSVVVREPVSGVLPCTNHFRSEDLGTAREKRCPRYDRLLSIQRQGGIFGGAFGVRDVAAAMHAVNQGPWTLQTMVFEPTTLKLHLSIGPPPSSARPLRSLDLGPLLKGGPLPKGKD